MRDYSRDKIPMREQKQRYQAYGAAVLAGAVGAPLILMTINVLPFVFPTILYGALAFFFAWIAPSRSGFRWGFLVTLGIPLAALIGILTGVVIEPTTNPVEGPFPHAMLFGAMLVLAITPALVGGLVGGTMGRWIVRRMPTER